MTNFRSATRNSCFAFSRSVCRDWGPVAEEIYDDNKLQTLATKKRSIFLGSRVRDRSPIFCGVQRFVSRPRFTVRHTRTSNVSFSRTRTPLSQ